MSRKKTYWRSFGISFVCLGLLTFIFYGQIRQGLLFFFEHISRSWANYEYFLDIFKNKLDGFIVSLAAKGLWGRSGLNGFLAFLFLGVPSFLIFTTLFGLCWTILTFLICFPISTVLLGLQLKILPALFVPIVADLWAKINCRLKHGKLVEIKEEKKEIQTPSVIPAKFQKTGGRERKKQKSPKRR